MTSKIRSLILCAALASTAGAGEVTITLPPEVPVLKPGKGMELVQANCLMCHSAEYIATQPPMPRKFWEAGVKKMIDKYGAPTPPDMVSAVVDYLTASYGVPDTPKP